MQWNPQQQRAIEKFQRWFANPDGRPFLLQGYAGTGKTTMLGHLSELANCSVSYCSPTGKAARVLSKKTGKDATTVHKFLYRPIENELMSLQKIMSELFAANPEDPQINEIQDRIRDLEKSDLKFAPKMNLENAGLLIVVDEASMIGKEMAQDLIDTGRPLLLVGDPFQLPPVKTVAGWNDLEPDVVLTQIMRQSSDEAFGIIQAATEIRSNPRMSNLQDGPGFKIHPPKSLSWAQFNEADIILCGTNDLRRRLNEGIRKFRGFEGPHPQVGEKVIALANHDSGIRNGEIFTVVEVNDVVGRAVYLRVVDDTGDFFNVRTWGPLYQNDSETDLVPDGFLRMTYAYAITVHKSQGSEWDHVVLCDSWPGQRYRNWLYTGITRAAKKCDFIRS